jgi:replicative DNA helicase
MSKPQPLPKLDLDFFETVLLFNALTDQEYLSSIISYVDPSLFNDKSIGKVMGRLAEFFSERGTVPTLTEIKTRLSSEEDRKALADVKPKLSQIEGPFNKDELVSNTEKFLKERFVYKTIINVAEKFSDSSFKLEEALVDFEKAYNISLSENLGLWYFDDIDEHIKELIAVYKPMPTGWKFLDDRIEGGLFPKTLTIFAGQVNVGKSIVLGNIAANMLLANKNVLLVSLEMSEFMYAKRISAQLSQIPHNDLKTYTEELKEQIKHIEKNVNSRLVIKEYPPKTVTVRQIASYVKKIKHKGFVPDIIVIDYINLIQPVSKGLNSYESVKEIAEQLRALSFEYNIPVVSATQLNRCLSSSSPVNMADGTIKPLSEIKIGDSLASFDFDTNQSQAVEVRHVYPELEQECFEITLEDGRSITCSVNHMFATPRGNISIEHGLTQGDLLYVISASDAPRRSMITSIKSVGVKKTIDIQVSKNNLFVANGIVTHNCGFNTTSPGMENISECIEINQMVTLRDGTTKKIKDVLFGDQVTANDEFKTVTQVHHIKNKPCYRIKLKSGKEIIVSEKHQFPTKRGRLSIESGLKIGDKLNSIKKLSFKERFKSACIKFIKELTK